MFERFTDRARRVVVFAQEEARLLNHGYIGTEHLLLGMLAEAEGVAAQVLGRLGVGREQARERVAEMMGRGAEPPIDHIPFTDDAKEALELSLREAIEMGHNYIGTEHVLLGLLRMSESKGAQVLQSMGIDLDDAKGSVIERLGEAGGSERVVLEPPMANPVPASPPATALLRRDTYDPALVSLLFVTVALTAVVVEPPQPNVRLWGLSLLLAGVLLWAGGAIIGTGGLAKPRSRGMGRLLRVLGGVTLAAAASVFVLGVILI